MFLPLTGLFGDTRFWEFVATAASAIAAYAQQRAAAPPVDPVDDLTTMVRTPLRWRLRHPVKAARRVLRRRP